MNWLESFVESYSEAESPARFFYWSALTALSATVKNNIWLDRHTYTLYPNIYTFLIAASGMKKGVPVLAARTMLNTVDNTKVISGRNSIQQVLSDLSKPYAPQNKKDVVRGAHGIMIASELAAFFIKDPDSLTILTDVYDTGYYNKEWKYSLRSGIVRLQNPCLSLLGATNEEHFDDAIPPSQIVGGFIARTFVIYSDKPGNLNSLTQKPKKLVNLNDFTPFLENAATLRGPIKWTAKAKATFDTFYYPHMQGITTDRTGTLRRLPDQILKVAMLLTLNNNTMELHSNAIDEAIVTTEEAARDSAPITAPRGKGQFSVQISMILRELVKAENNTRDKNYLTKRFWQEGYSSTELDIVIETLSNTLIISGSAKNPIYKLKQDVVDEYTRNVSTLKRKLNVKM